MKDYVAKNKWFQHTNKEITHLKTTNDEYNCGNDDASVASDADVSIASGRSGRSAEKNGWSGLQICHTQSKSEISDDAHGDVLILLDNWSTTIILRKK